MHMAPSVALRMGGYQGPKSVHTRAAHILGAEWQRRYPDGHFTFEEDVTKRGRPSIALFDMVEGDELELCHFASSYLAHRVPNLAIFDLPFQIDDRASIYAKLDGALGQAIADDVARRTGFTVLGYWDNGFRHFSNRLRPLRAPADCRGLTIRTMNSAVHQKSFAALGFKPTFIDVKDFPGAVRSGAVDAQENPLTNTVNFKVHESHPYVTMTGHFYGVSLVLGNAARIAALPQVARAALDEAMAEATQAQRGFAAEDDILCLQELRAAGVEVLDPDSFDREAFARATAGVVESEAAALDPKILALLRS
jgi:tripartite ATP-independent transporter DctP family solute receptor